MHGDGDASCRYVPEQKETEIHMPAGAPKNDENGLLPSIQNQFWGPYPRVCLVSGTSDRLCGIS